MARWKTHGQVTRSSKGRNVGFLFFSHASLKVLGTKEIRVFVFFSHTSLKWGALATAKFIEERKLT